MNKNSSKFLYEALTYDDVLLVPGYSEVLPRETSTATWLTKKIRLNIPLVSAAMDTVTESELAIAIALEGGLGFIHKNMSIEKQAAQVRKVKRSQAGMILDPITLDINSKVKDAEAIMREFNIGGIPDILIHKKTGWISATFDLIDFSKGINWILKEEGRSEKLGLNGRKNVIKKFSSERVSKQYYDLYQKVLTTN